MKNILNSKKQVLIIAIMSLLFVVINNGLIFGVTDNQPVSIFWSLNNNEISLLFYCFLVVSALFFHCYFVVIWQNSFYT